jgi:hypothetical protein
VVFSRQSNFFYALTKTTISTNGSITSTIAFFQKSSEINDNTQSTGINSFYEIMAHEDNHCKIRKTDRWPNGYIANEDSDKDLVPDKDEETLPELIALGFKVRTDLIPDIKDIYNYNPSLPFSEQTKDYQYQETKCLSIETDMKNQGISNDYDNQDWSYDSNNTYQGKQW